MAKKLRTVVLPEVHRGRRPKFGLKIERQISVGIDPVRGQQLTLVQQHLQQNSVGVVTDSDVMRHAFDTLVTSLQKEVPELLELITPAVPTH